MCSFVETHVIMKLGLAIHNFLGATRTVDELLILYVEDLHAA